MWALKTQNDTLIIFTHRICSSLPWNTNSSGWGVWYQPLSCCIVSIVFLVIWSWNCWRNFQLQMTKNIYIKYTFFKLSYLTNWASSTNYYSFRWHIIWLKICLKPYIYTGLAIQGLIWNNPQRFPIWLIKQIIHQKRLFNPFEPEFTILIFIYPLQAANCCRNSRLVVDKDDLKVLDKVNKITMYL